MKGEVGKGSTTKSLRELRAEHRSLQFHQWHISASGKTQENERLNIEREYEAVAEELKITREDMAVIKGSIRHANKTFARKIAENLMEYGWYYPQKQNRNHADLSKAWEYFEMFVLPRHFCDSLANKSSGLERASPGEYHRETKLYSPISTPHSELSDFGIGIGLYFTDLRWLTVVMFVAGLLHIPIALYYGSDTYKNENPEEVYGPIRYSAMCNRVSFVPCINCTLEDYWDKDPSRFAQGIDVGYNFTLKNECKMFSIDSGIGVYFALLAVFFFLLVINKFLNLAKDRFDESEQTATDYSIEVINPPPTAINPTEWRKFFHDLTGHRVTMCSIALNNHDLLKCLVERRRRFRTLQGILADEEGMKFDSILDVKKITHAAQPVVEKHRKDTSLGMQARKLLGWDAVYARNRIAILDERIIELQKKEYSVARVFLTFEKEEGQRAALSALDFGSLQRWHDYGRDEPQLPAFRGYILKVREPTEPSAIRWQDLGRTTRERRLRIAFTTVGFLCVIFFSSYWVKVLEEVSGLYAAIFISSYSYVIPKVATYIHAFEIHDDEDFAMQSLFVKQTLVSWSNIALVIYNVVPFTSLLADGNGGILRTLNILFFVLLIVGPCIAYVDFTGFVKKHILAPRAKLQDQMNRYLSGTDFNISQIYTEMNQIIFLTCFYGMWYPFGYFFCGFALILYYYNSKFCLMRIWSNRSSVGTQVAGASQKYIDPLYVLTIAIMAGYFAAQFPFDLLCETEDFIPMGPYQVQFANSTNGTLSFGDNIKIHGFCDQNILMQNNNFPPKVVDFVKESGGTLLNRMQSDQETMIYMFGWTSFVLAIIYSVYTFGKETKHYCTSLFFGTYEPPGKCQSLDFSNVEEIFGYIPHVRKKDFTFPLLACDIDGLDENFIGWDDRQNGFDYHNLIFDIPYAGLKRRRNKATTTNYDESSLQRTPRPIFSIVKHWPPSWTFSEKPLQEFGDDEELSGV